LHLLFALFRLALADLDDMEAELRGDRADDITRLAGKSGIFEGFDHGAAGKETEIPALDGRTRILGVQAGQFSKIGSAAGFGENLANLLFDGLGVRPGRRKIEQHVLDDPLFRLLELLFMGLVISLDLGVARVGDRGEEIVGRNQKVLRLGLELTLHEFGADLLVADHCGCAQKIVQLAHRQGRAQILFDRSPELTRAGIVERGLVALHVKGPGGVPEGLILTQLHRRIIENLVDDLLVRGVQFDRPDLLVEKTLLHQIVENTRLELLELIALRITARLLTIGRQLVLQAARKLFIVDRLAVDLGNHSLRRTALKTTHTPIHDDRQDERKDQNEQNGLHAVAHAFHQSHSWNPLLIKL